MDQTKRHIAFICSRPGHDFFNRKSSHDSFLSSILLLLQDDFYFTVNGEDFEKLHRLSKADFNPDLAVKSLSRKNPISRFIPGRIKEILKIRTQKRHNKSLLEKLKGKRPDMVFELLSRGSNVGALLSRHFNVPYLIFYDSPLSFQYAEIFKRKSPSFIFDSEKYSITNASAILVYSDPVSQYIKKTFKPGNSVVFYKFPTLDYSRLTFQMRKNKSDTNPITIGFIGTFMPWHSIDKLVDCFDSIRNKGISAKLLLVGAGETYSLILKKVENSPYSTDITMTGFVDGEKLMLYKSQMDIGVMPGSNWYGVPTKVFEYGAMGIASIAPATPTISDIFNDGSDIQLFENENFNDLEQKLLELICNPDLRTKLEKGLQSRISSEFTSEVAIGFYKRMFYDIISK